MIIINYEKDENKHSCSAHAKCAIHQDLIIVAILLCQSLLFGCKKDEDAPINDSVNVGLIKHKYVGECRVGWLWVIYTEP